MKKIYSILFFIPILLLFKEWFLTKNIIGGDWPFFYQELLNEFKIFPPAWASYQSNGLGGQSITYSLDSYLYFIVTFFTNTLGIPWEIVYRFFFFGIFLILSYFSSIYLLKTILPESKNWNFILYFIAGLIYTTNTYILMLVGGGQMGVGLAYSIAPMVLASFFKLIPNGRASRTKFLIQNSIIAGLVLALQIMFDARIACLTLVISGLYICIQFFSAKKNLSKNSFAVLLLYLTISIITSLFFHASWLLPFILAKANPLDSVLISLQSLEGFKFFSFADFSHSLSLLHPNWPENIFGKIYFLKPEFLILPLFAYSSLLFVISNQARFASKSQISNAQLKSQNLTIVFLALLGLTGAFLSKGANPPFENINEWLFLHIPLLQILRDPTKFYLFIALSYSILIPYTLSRIPKKFTLFTVFIFLCFWIFTIRQAIFGQLGGTFAMHVIPQEYTSLAKYISDQPQFFRTLWVPRQQRFTFYSNQHPSVEGVILFDATNSAELAAVLEKSKTSKELSRLAIRYIIVPYDPLGEIFTNDRKYDEVQYQSFVKVLDRMPWLKKVDRFGKIAVYETPTQEDHFFLEREPDASYVQESSTSYRVSFFTDEPIDLVFSENYSPFWKADVSGSIISSEKTKDGLNKFTIPGNKNREAKITFDLENYYRLGRIIAGITLLICIFILVKVRKQH